MSRTITNNGCACELLVCTFLCRHLQNNLKHHDRREPRRQHTGSNFSVLVMRSNWKADCNLCRPILVPSATRLKMSLTSSSFRFADHVTKRNVDSVSGNGVVLRLATQHSLFWRSVGNVSLFLWFTVFSFTTHKEVPFWCLLLKFPFEEKFYNEHPWGRKML